MSALMPEPCVSIVMPAYNREKYVASAIESVLAQTFGDWELIVVDDGSRDDTRRIAERYAATHPGRITVIVQPNSGVVIARNTGIRAARGTYIAFIDSDDLWYSEKLARQVACFQLTPDAAFVYTGYETIDADDRTDRIVRPDTRFRGNVRDLLWTEPNEILGPTLMVRRQALFQVGLFDERLRAAENVDLRLKLARLGPIEYVDAVLYRYRKHGDSLTADSAAMLDQTLKMIQCHFDGPLDPPARRLRDRALATYFYRLGNHHFEQASYRRAFAAYSQALVKGDTRRRDIVTRCVRCLMGNAGNTALRCLKRRFANPLDGGRLRAAGQDGYSA
jgi:glycosyltransferase involved in cell wall biosynthesis